MLTLAQGFLVAAVLVLLYVLVGEKLLASMKTIPSQATPPSSTTPPVSTLPITPVEPTYPVATLPPPVTAPPLEYHPEPTPVPPSTASPSPPYSPPKPPSYAYKGCYADSSVRALPIGVGDMSVDDCAKKAQNAGYKAFGIQFSDGAGMHNYGGQCFIGEDRPSVYGQYGPATSCYTDGTKHYGDSWSNAVYEWQ